MNLEELHKGREFKDVDECGFVDREMEVKVNYSLHENLHKLLL